MASVRSPPSRQHARELKAVPAAADLNTRHCAQSRSDCRIGEVRAGRACAEPRSRLLSPRSRSRPQMRRYRQPQTSRARFRTITVPRARGRDALADATGRMRPTAQLEVRFLKRRTSRIEVADAANALKLSCCVGQRIAAIWHACRPRNRGAPVAPAALPAASSVGSRGESRERLSRYQRVTRPHPPPIRGRRRREGEAQAAVTRVHLIEKDKESSLAYWLKFFDAVAMKPAANPRSDSRVHKTVRLQPHAPLRRFRDQVTAAFARARWTRSSTAVRGATILRDASTHGAGVF